VHHGISLKRSEKTAKVPIGNSGLKSSHGGEEIHSKHKRAILRKYPHLAHAGVAARKAEMRSNKRMSSEIRTMNLHTLHKVAHNLHTKFEEMTPKQKEEHLRKHVLGANHTPMERAGHHHHRHITHVKKSGIEHHIEHPATQHDHILKDIKNVNSSHSGTSVNFYHKGKKFAAHRFKFTSQSDPLSSIKGSLERR